MKRWLIIVMGLLVVAGCATSPTSPAPPHRPALELDAWVLEGRVAMTDGQNSWQSSITWEQRGAGYRIDLVGALGQGQIRIRGDEQGVVLHQGEHSFHAEEADQLLAEATGLSLPISGLRYWLLGLATPDTPVTPVTDAQGRTRQLQQAGWLIHYLNYIQVDEFDLPQRLRAVYEPFTVQLFIRQWTLI